MRTQMAIQYLQAGRLEQAETLCLQALHSDPRDVSAVRLLVKIYSRQGEVDHLIEMLRLECSLSPGNVDLLYRLGAELRGHGSFAEARDVFVSALKLQPDRSEVYVNLAMITHYSEYNAEIATMETLYAECADDAAQRKNLAFALGKVFDDLGDYDKAFGFFREGNSIVCQSSGHSIDSDIRWFKKIQSTFDAKFFRRHQNSGIADRTAIFVTGMPRTGTTLVEQILASHSEVHGGGELPNLHNIIIELASAAGGTFPHGFDQLDAGILQATARAYLSQIKPLARGKAFVTDKSISNFFYLGLINVMMPNAIIINCRRDPLDLGLSVFQKDIREQQWGYDLESIGRSYGMYYDLLEHWEQLLPGKVCRIQYEALVAEPETSIRRLLDHCELGFEEACLAFHKTDRIVSTASEAQVRRPIYQSSVGRWKNYEKHLGPLIAALR